MPDIELFNKIKNTVENFNKQQQIEILKILVNNSVNISENSNGTFVNLTELDNDIIVKIKNYIDFTKTQDNNLSTIESEKINIENNFFNVRNKSISNVLEN